MSIEASLLALTLFIERDDEKQYRVQNVESNCSEKHEIVLSYGQQDAFLKAGFTFNCCAR